MPESVIINSIPGMVDFVIHEEGGYLLTDNKSDPDIWTFAGMRGENVNVRMEARGWGTLKDYAAAKAFLDKGGFEMLRELVRAEYVLSYITPLRIELMPAMMRLPLLSCGVNRSPKAAIKLLQRCLRTFGAFGMITDGIAGPRTVDACKLYANENWLFRENFVKEWQLEYINLCQENAIAWERYKNDPFNDVYNPRGNGKPSLKAIDFLEGWYRRAEKYRKEVL